MPSGTFCAIQAFLGHLCAHFTSPGMWVPEKPLEILVSKPFRTFPCWTGPNMDEGGWIILSRCTEGSFCSDLQSEYRDFWRLPLPQRHLGCCSLKGAGVWKVVAGRTTGWHDLKNASPVELPQATQLTQLRPKFRWASYLGHGGKIETWDCHWKRRVPELTEWSSQPWLGGSRFHVCNLVWLLAIICIMSLWQIYR